MLLQHIRKDLIDTKTEGGVSMKALIVVKFQMDEMDMWTEEIIDPLEANLKAKARIEKKREQLAEILEVEPEDLTIDYVL